MKVITGGCYCGAVRYRSEVEPLGSMICHCTTCRRIAGAPVVPWVTFPIGRFEFVGARPIEFSSSPGVHRTHCAQCGTQITYRGGKFPDEVDVATCTLDDPNAFPPTHHSWVGHDLQWVRFGDGLPSFPESRTTAKNP